MYRVLFVFCLLYLSGCKTTDVFDVSSFGDKDFPITKVPDVSYYPNDELVRRGKTQFKQKNYGHSYAMFKRAVEIYPEDPQAWLGYAASADLIGRFDNADIGYRNLSKMIPNTTVYFNNVGYSHLLRGNLRQARRHFLKAYEIDPSNETTANNLELLRNSATFAKRG